jgi:hypothetical protein
LSPILLNIVVDMLGILIKRAKADGQVEGLVPNSVVSSVYGRYTLIFGA